MRLSHDEVRERARAWALELAAHPSTVYLDTETTGFGSGAEIVDIAIVDARGEVLLDCLVRPTQGIPAGASAIHGIHDRHVVAAPTWPEVSPTVLRMLAGRPVVVYNAPYDRDMLFHACARHAIAWDRASVRWECAMREYAKYRGDRDPGRGGWRWHRLEAAAAQVGAMAGGHRALGDARACREVVLAMAGGR